MEKEIVLKLLGGDLTKLNAQLCYFYDKEKIKKDYVSYLKDIYKQVNKMIKEISSAMDILSDYGINTNVDKASTIVAKLYEIKGNLLVQLSLKGE